MSNNRNIAFWLVLFLLIVVLFNVFSSGTSSLQSREISYSDFVASVEAEKLQQSFLMEKIFVLKVGIMLNM